MPQEELIAYYRRAKVHAMPSWFETTGLSSLEAAAMACNVVIADKGDTREYFGDDGFYSDPADPQSILEAVQRASSAELNQHFREEVYEKYTWENTAGKTLDAYLAYVKGVNN